MSARSLAAHQQWQYLELGQTLGQTDHVLPRKYVSEVHSDQGAQHTSVAFGLRCKEMGVRPSMGSVGDCHDCEYGIAA
ncbi:MAG: hypothetical protein GKR99_04365 [Rhodobacteraceae bacterium]|nr:hypothetical protein [Paracoccaceae bacterium]